MQLTVKMNGHQNINHVLNMSFIHISIQTVSPAIILKQIYKQTVFEYN